MLVKWWLYGMFLKATERFHTISDFCHTVPLTQPLIIFSLYPWNLLFTAPKQQIACQSGHRSCVKIKRDFTLILSGHQSVGRERGGGVAFLRKFNTTEWAELHEIQSQLTAAGSLLPMEVPEPLWIYKGFARRGDATSRNTIVRHNSL